MYIKKLSLVSRIKYSLAVFGLVILSGCAESKFMLAPESRLPKWFDTHSGISRSNVNVTMTYYVKSSGREAVFNLFDNDGKLLKRVVGSQRGLRPYRLKNPPPGFPKNRPSYEVITVDGITDIVEHRVRGPVFHITDDPVIWAEISKKNGDSTIFK